MAESYGMEGYKVETIEEFESAFKKAQASDKSVVIDAKINQAIMEW